MLRVEWIAGSTQCAVCGDIFHGAQPWAVGMAMDHLAREHLDDVLRRGVTVAPRVAGGTADRGE